MPAHQIWADSPAVKATPQPRAEQDTAVARHTADDDEPPQPPSWLEPAGSASHLPTSVAPTIWSPRARISPPPPPSVAGDGAATAVSKGSDGSGREGLDGSPGGGASFAPGAAWGSGARGDEVR